MKKILYIFVALFVAGCSEQDVYKDIKDIVDAPNIISEVPAKDQYSDLLVQARWGISWE